MDTIIHGKKGFNFSIWLFIMGGLQPKKNSPCPTFAILGSDFFGLHFGNIREISEIQKKIYIYQKKYIYTKKNPKNKTNKNSPYPNFAILGSGFLCFFVCCKPPIVEYNCLKYG